MEERQGSGEKVRSNSQSEEAPGVPTCQLFFACFFFFFFAKKGAATGADLREAFGVRDSKASWGILFSGMMEPQGPEMCGEAEPKTAKSHLLKYNFIYSFSFGCTRSSLLHRGFL